MLAMEYCVPHPHKYACSTMSSETLSGSCGSRNNRIRTVRLVRPNNGLLPPPNLSCRHGPSLGFSIRGGREHGTGFFVSYVESGSEASNQGLRVGDQIVRINGFPIEDAIHKEVLQLISNHTHVTLKVRNVGMIPVKDKKTDSLSWQIISDNNSSRSSPQLSEKLNDVRINIMVAPRSKLGCGICKGPDWKPGIFVQFTKENGIAREAGLRPGDQILYCNNVDFSDIPFNEAVSLMKTSRQLDLVVRKSAGSELFPGESSGYNSSASSVTGDQSPSWSDSKRLSIVKEENLDLEDRLSNLDRLNKRLSNCKKWDTLEWEEDAEAKPFFKPTIINVSESGTTIKNNGSDKYNFDYNTNNNKITDIRMVSQQHETKTVIVEVHRSDIDESTEKTNTLTNSSSASDISSLTSKSSNTSIATSSLSSAICMEIQRRIEKKVTNEGKPSIDEQLQMKKILKGINTDQQYQHNKLMDEFKKAHEKMFKGPSEVPQKNTFNSQQNNVVGKNTLDRLAHKELSQKLSERLSNLANNGSHAEQLPASKTRQISANGGPPPPPPPPSQNGVTRTTTSSPSSSSSSSSHSNTIKTNKTKPKAPPVPVKYSILSSYNQPPPCPTPDYDTLSISSSISNKNRQHISDSVEMESLESFKINGPSDITPKPPSTYFQKRQLNTQLSNGSVSSVGSLNKSRPVSVTIGEYPTMRRQPGRLDFIQNGTEEIRKGNQPITSQLASELTQTLNRSNLRKRTESMENLLGKACQTKQHTSGSVKISLGNSLSKHFVKSTGDLTRDLDVNRVMINVNHDKKSDSPSGILKNSAGSNVNSLESASNHKPLVHQKSITFGELPVVIKEHPLPVT